MTARLHALVLTSVLLAGVPAVAMGQASGGNAGTAETQPHVLAGTSWQLVRFQGGDDKVLAPDDRSRYTLAFDATGNNVAVRLDCNRGRGVWKSSGPNGLQFGPLALTRAMCADPTIHDHLAGQWEHIRSFVIRDGHLFLSLAADGGIYEFEPAPGTEAPAPVASRGPFEWSCTSGTGGAQTLRFTHYETTPAFVLLEFDGVTRPAFQTISASGARYEGSGGLLFWEARGEAQFTWSGTTMMCRPRS